MRRGGVGIAFGPRDGVRIPRGFSPTTPGAFASVRGGTGVRAVVATTCGRRRLSMGRLGVVLASIQGRFRGGLGSFSTASSGAGPPQRLEFTRVMFNRRCRAAEESFSAWPPATHGILLTLRQVDSFPAGTYQ